MRIARGAAFVPAHISGFFQPFILRSPERSGSRNCGPCLEVGVRTEVHAEPSERSSVEVIIDGEPAPEARTSRLAAWEVLARAGGKYRVRIVHRCEVPVGAGYGASGAGALGTAIALSSALGLGMKREEIVRAAHRAEVMCRTGLGDVGAQAIGGLVLTISPGAPPHGAWRRIRVPGDLRIVCATLGTMSTKEVLANRAAMRRVGLAGRRAFERVESRPTLKEFLAASKGFMEESGLADDEIVEVVEIAERAGAMGASQAMLGRSVFALCRGTLAGRVRDEIRRRRPDSHLMIAGVRGRGPETPGP